MAWTTPATATAGSTALTAAFWNQQVRDNLSEAFPGGPTLTTYTPTLAQGASTNITKTVNFARYMVIGKTMFLWIRVFATGTGSAGSAITVSLPSGYTAENGDGFCGSGLYGDSGAQDYPALVYIQSSTTIALMAVTTTNSNRIGVTPNIAVANNDAFQAQAMIPLV